MTERFEFVSTRKGDWQRQCLEWANDRKSFRLFGVASNHFAFCHEICFKFDYQIDCDFRGDESEVLFRPVSSHPI